MKGWLRYADEQVADFTGGNLISICGENGAGKSSIFDAITFALYGRHRLGAISTEELISQDADALEVEFDFENDNRRFRVHRGRSRGATAKAGNKQAGSATFALYAWDDGTNQWVIVQGTNSAQGLQQAIDRVLNLSDEAFTSSFMLQQGSATRFLDARPAERFRIISSLIDLEAYEQLAQASGQKARDERRRADDIRRDLEALILVTNESVEAQNAKAVDSQNAALLANDAYLKAAARATDAARHAQFCEEIAALSRKIAEADTLLIRREAIEADARSFESLDAVLDALRHVDDDLAHALSHTTAAQRAAEEAASVDLPGLELVVARAKETLQKAGDAFAEADKKVAVATKQEREATDFLHVARSVLAARSRLAQSEEESARLETALEGLPSAREEAASLQALGRALAPISGLATAMRKLEDLEETAPVEAQEAARNRLATVVKEEPTLQKQLALAEGAAVDAARECVAAATNHSSLTEQLSERRAAAGEAICSRCGQAVTPEHAAREIADLTLEVEKAAEILAVRYRSESVAAAALQSSRDALEACRGVKTTIEREVDRLEVAVKSLTETRQAVSDRRAEAETIAPPSLIAALAGQDSAGIVAVLLANEGIEARARAASDRLEQLINLQGRHEATQRESLAARQAVVETEAKAAARLDDVASAEANYQKAAVALRDSSEAQQLLLTSFRAAEESLAQEEKTLSSEHERRRDLLEVQERHLADAVACRSSAAAHARVLPQPLRERGLVDPAPVIAEMSEERGRLSNAPQLLVQLRAAEQERTGWDAQRTQRLRDIEAIPTEHRLPVEEAQEYEAACRRTLADARNTAEGDRDLLVQLNERLDQKDRLNAQLVSATRRQQRLSRLSTLLGRTGLQGALVTEALNTITSHANSFLGRITGGSLQLTLKRDAAADNIELQAIDTTSMRDARNARVLSGSQQFRCAVAIAYGIGQYFGAGGMRSIVIDEGFGSLDELGQRQMVEELRNLSEHLDKVIVVSHLDLFRDPSFFPHQLFVEKRGTVSIIRLQD